MKHLLVFSHAAVLEVNRALFQAMAQTGETKVTMVVPEKWSGDLISDLRFEHAASDHGITTIPLPVAFSGNGSLFFHRARLAPLFEKLDIDHVFVDEEPWSVAAQQIYRSLKKFPLSIYTKQNLKKRVPPPFQMFQNHVFRKSANAFACSDEVKQVLEWKGYKGLTHYLPHSYDPRAFQPLSVADRAATRAKLGVPRDATVVAYFGRLTQEKGIDDLLAAMKAAASRPKMRNTHFLWVGNGPMFKEVEAAIGQGRPGSATLLPAIAHNEVGRALAAADVLVLPSRTTPRWKEQFGRIIIEALGCGVPVLGSDSGEIPNLIRQTLGGEIYAEQDAKALLAKLENLVSDAALLARYREHGLASVRERFTHQAVAALLRGKLFGQTPASSR